MLALIRLALRVLWREGRAGELGILVGALVIAVASVTAVGLFTDRLQRGMSRQGAELLGADLVVRGSAPIEDARARAAAALGLATTRTVSLRSVVVRGDAFQLVEAKAVGPGYPLRGHLRIAEQLYGPETAAAGIPAPGTVWVEPRLAARLGLSRGAPLALGEARLTVSAFLTSEPDRAGDLFSIAPRVLLNLADIPATGLIQPGTRARYRLLVAGPADAVTRYRAMLARTPVAGEQVRGVEDARPELRATLTRARQFLGLAALAAVLLAGVSIALSARRYARRHLDTAGLLRCFGASRRAVLGIFSVQLLTLGVGAGLVGAALGYAAQTVLVALLSSLFLQDLPAPSLAAAALGQGFGLVVLLGFGLPPLAKLGRVPPARVLRRDEGGPSGRNLLAYAAAGATIAGLALWFASDAVLAAYVLGGALGAGLLLGAGALALVRGLQRLRARVGVAWRFGLSNIARRGSTSAIQIVSYGLGLMALLLLAVVRSDLLETWQRTLPARTPNYFLVNVQPDEAPAVRRYLGLHGVPEAAAYPMIRGRLTAIGARKVTPEDYPEGRARHLAAREFNLSYAARLPAGNTVAAGRWWGDPPRDPAQLSVESGLAATLGIALGDTLTFRVAGTTVRGTVTSLRTVQWDSFRVNFFVIGTPGLLRGQPATYISSFHLPPRRRAVLSELVRRHPSVTIIDVGALLSEVRRLMDQAARGVEFVFGFTLLAGLSVLLASVRSTLDERRFESALLRTLGASRARVWRGIAAEFLTLGLLAGVLAAAGAALTGSVLAARVLDLAYHGSWWLWITGVPAGALGIGLAGLLGTRRVLTVPPAATLRVTST